MKKYTRGFTLIELLVVIAIIGILASVVLVSLNSARSKGKDSHLISGVNGLRTGLESAYDGTKYNVFFTQTATAGSPTLSDTNMTTTINDIIAYAPTGYTQTLGTTVWAGNAVPYNSTAAVIIATNVAIPATGTALGNMTAYAIRARLSTGAYFCIDSTGNTKPTEAAPASGNWGSVCI